MDFIEYVKLFGAMLGSVGGATVVIVGLSKWFGDFLAKRLLDNYNNKHKEELEGLKGKYQKELEETKSDLERAKSLFLRYSEKQFELYNDLWSVLLYTKNQADSLWESASPEKIPAFSEQIRLAQNAIDDNLLLIEEDHYDQLKVLIGKFEQFQFGKTKLIEIRDKSEEEIQALGLTNSQTKDTIYQNRELKEEYDKIIMKIGRSFRDQLKG